MLMSILLSLIGARVDGFFYETERMNNIDGL